MKNKKKIDIQGSYKAVLSENVAAIFDVQTDFKPTSPLLHKESRFLYILSGNAKIKIQNTIHDMNEGKLISLLPWQISEIVEVTEPVTYYLLIYKFDFVNNVIKNTLNINDEKINMIELLYHNSSVNVSKFERAKISKIFEDIRDDIGIRSIDIELNSKKYSSIFVLAKLTELIIYYLRLVQIPDEEDVKPVISEEIFKYMYLNSSNDLSLEKLSKIFLMSESSISKYITSMTGLGFYDLLNEMRLSKAQFLLLHTNLTLEDISKILHFSNPAQLSKIFSSNYGIGTKRFRDSNKNLESLVNIRLDTRSMKIIQYIYENYEENIDIVDVSKLFDISPRNINKILKYYVEQNFRHFLNTVRVNKASELLLNTNYSITDIGMMVGFDSTKTFTRNFIKTFSMTPTEFRVTTLEQFD